MAHRRAFKYMIGGFLLVLIDIHNFDILPDPIGYMMIASGIHQLGARQPNALRAEITAYLLMALSIPTLFLSGQLLNPMQINSTGWVAYGLSVTVTNLILIYFVFRMLIHEVDYPIETAEKPNRTRKLMIVYMAISLSSAFIQPFLIHMKQGVQSSILVATIVLTLAVHIAFIVHLRTLQKTFPVRDIQ
ncbi:hypothetical protein [Paenisporosarcina sp. NPDC076898]|uniref:hypothetical protein n=1 Tax=unclassified Paenisporosarcina TaxID=2642018 RepID=UPI003D079169